MNEQDRDEYRMRLESTLADIARLEREYPHGHRSPAIQSYMDNLRASAEGLKRRLGINPNLPKDRGTGKIPTP